ncbi:MAG TPA: prolipoprotein diacylglyceryl transferase [Acidobacteriaceae bacterium]|jgi:phosphatidylglycerol:prolipoprotein diacylglycerol transferase|nr:prolipoprotein diacylglyceryl transferase [Acidobacteriaceae bacterium]
MYPFIHIGRFSIGTFGIMLWLAAVAACWILHGNFRRWKIEADAISIVAVSTVAGVIGAKLWHVLESPHALMLHPADLLFDRAGFAWYGGLIVGILTLLWQAKVYKLGSLRMLDLAAPAAAIGYGVGRLGCLISGDGDYGIPTKLPWGMSFSNGLVPTPPGVRVHPTPIYELIGALFILWILWRRGGPERPKPLGEITGEYLVLSGIARFLVEFIRINPRILWGMTNAQLASVGSVVVGIGLILVVRSHAARSTAAAAPRQTAART